MESLKLCEPCHRLFHGHAAMWSAVRADFLFDHHESERSLSLALQLPCSICSRFKDLEPGEGSITGGFFYPGGEDERYLTFSQSADGKELCKFVLCKWDDHPIKQNCPRPLSNSTASKQTLEFVRSKYQTCCNNHTLCTGQYSLAEPFHPSKIMDVGNLGDPLIRLRVGTYLASKEPYVCLSHMWGSQSLEDRIKRTKWGVLTKERVAPMLNGFPTAGLPQTFQDAILITRELGFKYLWIDSLCIVQDDLGDWGEQASRMRDIYSHAACTIAASSAVDSYSGIFSQRDSASASLLRIPVSLQPRGEIPNPSKPQVLEDVYCCDEIKSWDRDVEQAPLYSRAWVCQERLLSRRIIHFTSTQVYWECIEWRSSENYPYRLPFWASPGFPGNSTALRYKLSEYKKQKGTLECHADIGNVKYLYICWLLFREYYDACAMTREEDKLVALQGIAQHFGKLVEDELVAGLWRSQIIPELCWYKASNEVRAPRRSCNWRAPTWSWASSDDTTFNSRNVPHFRFYLYFVMEQTLPEVEAIDVRAKASGELQHATLDIKCRLVEIDIHYIHRCSNPEDCEDYECNRYSIGNVSESDLDEQKHISITLDGPGHIDGIRLPLLIIHQYRVMNDRDVGIPPPTKEPDGTILRKALEGLILENVDEGKKNVFKRIGHFRMKGTTSIDRLLEDYKRAETEIIRLI